MRFILALLTLFLLAGCDGATNSAPPTPVPAPAPSAPAQPIVALRPQRKVFAGDWSGPDVKCAFAINGDVPPVDSIPAGSDAFYGTFPDPVATPLTQPGPNALYSADGKLHLSAKNIAYPLISRQTFSRNGIISMQAEVTLDRFNDDTGWGGLVVYNGDAAPLVGPSTLEEQEANMWKTGNWRGLYFTKVGGVPYIGYWSESYIEELIEAEVGRPYTFRIDYTHSKPVWNYYISDENGLLFSLTEGPDNVHSTDRLDLLNDPHFAIFLGGIDLTIGPADVMEG